MPIRRDRLENAQCATQHALWSPIAALLSVVLFIVAFFALMLLVSRPFKDGEQQANVARPHGALFASLNPWRVDDEASSNYVSGDGTRLDPMTPSSSDEFFAADDESVLVAEDSRVEMGNEGETTRQGAEFAELELPSDNQVDYVAMDWNPVAAEKGKQNAAPSSRLRYEPLDFQPINEFAADGLLGNTLVNNGKPTYEPKSKLPDTTRHIDNAAADVVPVNPSKVALDLEDSVESPEMTPVERIQPGVAFIHSGYRRGGVAQASGSGSMGVVSTITR